MQSCQSKYVLVTGASRGIGRSISAALALAGYGLILWARSARELGSTAEVCRDAGADVRTALVDVADPESVASAARETLPAALRGLVINAGVGRWAPLSETTTEHWRDTLGTNLDGSFHTLRASLPALRKHPLAQIIGTSSDSACFPHVNRSAYCASKAGLSSLLETLRREVRGQGIRVTQLVPSRVDTYFRGMSPGARPDALSSDDIGNLIVFVFSLPPRVELREIQVASIQSTFGPFEECITNQLSRGTAQ